MILSPFLRDIKVAYLESKDNLAIRAVAGSGKTTTLLMLGELVKHDSAIFLAFSSLIVKTINEKLKFVGSKMQAKTIHALGRAATWNNVKFGDINGNKYWQLAKMWIALRPTDYKGDDIETASKSLKELVDFTRLTLTDPKDHFALAGLADYFDIDVDFYIIQSVSEVIEKGASLEYIKEKSIDFTDMIYLPIFHNWKIAQYKEIFVDEVQDLNNLQAEFVKRSLDKNGRIVICGDEKQSIMGFSGSNTRSFFIVRDFFNCRELPLSVCYRCGSLMVDDARKIVPQILSPENQHLGEIRKIKETDILKEARDGDAILCRKTSPLLSLCLQFIAAGIPARVRGRGVAESLINHAKKVAKLGDFKDYYMLIDTYRGREVNRMVKTGKSDTVIANLNETCDCLEVLYNPTHKSIEEFCDFISGMFSDFEKGVTLSTVHRSKGLEWNRVFLWKPEFLPLRWKNQTMEEFEQEMNLKYVALTRAKNVLTYVVG